MKEQFLFDNGYVKKDDFVYEKIDEETSMTVTLVFNKNGSLEQNEQIENDIIKILTRRDI